jgi:ethanolamine utilization protein EutN
MQIHRVVRDLVTTKRNFWLAAKSLRVVEDVDGKLEVALDPVGCKPGDFVITIGISAARLATNNPMITTDLTIGGIIDHWSDEKWRT